VLSVPTFDQRAPIKSIFLKIFRKRETGMCFNELVTLLDRHAASARDMAREITTM
jgi:hypothetical protein